jgi:transposase
LTAAFRVEKGPLVVALMRLELDVGDLRREATRCRDAQAARHAGMGRQTLRDWVHRYNAKGLAGLCDRPHPGPTPRLTPRQQAELAQIVEDGPGLATDGVVRWRRIDLPAGDRQALRVQLHERSCGVRREGFTSASQQRPAISKADHVGVAIPSWPGRNDERPSSPWLGPAL